MKVKIFHQYEYYSEWLMCKVLKKIDPSFSLTDNIFEADIVLLGTFPGKYKYKILKLLKLLKGKKSPIIVNQSYENPDATGSHPMWEHSDFYLSFSSLSDSNNHLRFSVLYEYLSFGGEYDDNRARRPFGRLIDPKELLERSEDFSVWKKKLHRVSTINSHTSYPRSELLRKIAFDIPVDGYGAAYDHNISSYLNSKWKKYEVLSKYKFNAALENGWFPGYNTEKVVEAYACGAIPIYNLQPNMISDYNPDSLIIMNDNYSLPDILHNNEKLRDIYETPLINEAPDLSIFIEFVEKIVDKASQR